MTMMSIVFINTREDGAPVRWVTVTDGYDAMSRRAKQMGQVQEPGHDTASRREREKRIL